MDELVSVLQTLSFPCMSGLAGKQQSAAVQICIDTYQAPPKGDWIC